jgi:hypothetical protein
MRTPGLALWQAGGEIFGRICLSNYGLLSVCCQQNQNWNEGLIGCERFMKSESRVSDRRRWSSGVKREGQGEEMQGGIQKAKFF